MQLVKSTASSVLTTDIPMIDFESVVNHIFGKVLMHKM